MACPCCALIARYALTGEGEDVNLPKEGGMSNANETRPFDGEASCKPPKSAMCACNPAGVRPKHASSKPSEGYLMVFGEPMTVAIARPPLPKRKTPSTGGLGRCVWPPVLDEDIDNISWAESSSLATAP